MATATFPHRKTLLDALRRARAAAQAIAVQSPEDSYGAKQAAYHAACLGRQIEMVESWEDMTVKELIRDGTMQLPK